MLARAKAVLAGGVNSQFRAGPNRPLFFERVSPDSTVANPRCMMNTSPAESIIQILLVVKSVYSPEAWNAA